jgi:hypothetical protein
MQSSALRTDDVNDEFDPDSTSETNFNLSHIITISTSMATDQIPPEQDYESSDDDDADGYESELSMTPEPDELVSPVYHSSIDIDPINVNLEPIKRWSDDDGDDNNDGTVFDFDSAADADDVENDSIILPDFSELPSSKPTLNASVSWQQLTMTKAINPESKRITSITPISQRTAELKLKYSGFYNRRRSVACVFNDDIHELIKLDPDLMQIRDEYVQKRNNRLKH